ncbi:complex I NDUFA9 subunit family protein [Falsiroseomonas selenitidurans]|uniref:Complex I NDUFA9 subunit family protein n=1 Tax=Falsiroseomonas selenitidurans TaxID=2716335 RepID=A0ABX1DZ04_9PROT|nr:complex I NDUFA9 subunit family protein [Falsiroseomonas selenitidurans]NKC29713.1 complex I NDUFA9 subunit family protein [Falsiroseomonas selenitidurans]
MQVGQDRRVATVFGGAGFIGRYVVQRLAAQGYVVRVATRNPAGTRFLTTQGRVGQIVPLQVSVTDAPALARAVQGADVVVNLVGILHERRAGDFDRVQGEAPGLVAQAAAAAGVARLVHLSAIGADAASESLYARSKAKGEAAVLAAFPGATILRPSVVFGPEDQFFNRFAAMAQLLPFMPVVSGASRFQPVFVGDVADAVMAALVQDQAQGLTYELGGPRVMTMAEVLRFILDTTRRPKRMVAMPMGLMRLQAGFLEKLPNPALTRDQLLLLQKDNVAAADKPGLAALGIAPHSVEAVVPGYLRRYRPGGGRRDVVAA